MKHISLHAVNNLYTCAGHSTIHKHKVYHEHFQALCFAISRLQFKLGELVQDDDWKEFLREVKCYRFLLNAAPLPVNFHVTELISSMQTNIIRCRYSYPNYVEYMKGIIDQLSILSELHDNPLLDIIERLVICDKPQFFAILLKEAYLIPLVEDVVIGLKPHNIELVNQYQLRGSQYYDQLLVIGPSQWHPEYILSSPRAMKVHLIRYNWVPDTWTSHEVFVRPFIEEKPSLGTKRDVEDKYYPTHNDIVEIHEYNGEDIIPEINWKQVSSKLIKQTQDDHNQELLLAKLYLLAGNYAVFLEADEDTKIFVLDLDADEEDEDEEVQEVKRISISKVRSGMYLLLRTEGGGDYIVQVADRMLQSDAAVVRAKQAHWKSLLRKVVETKGLFQVSLDLIDCGSEHANEVNVRNWMSSKSICPRDDKDFQAILWLVGLHDKEQEYQSAAEQIKKAHRQAGFHIRNLLLEQVMKADLGELHRKGHMNFELSEVEGGSLTAFRIEHISPDISPIPASRIGHPAAVGDIKWFK